MAAHPPDAHSVQQALAAIASGNSPADAELFDWLRTPRLHAGLDRWGLWTLICLCRHLNRQRWVGYVVETRLKGDLARLGAAGALGYPEGVPQKGEVPDEPGWRYYFHGRGCCLTNKETGTSIDVDFTDEGATDQIDRYFYSRFLEELKLPGFPETMLQRKEPLEHAWQADLDALVEAGCLDPGRPIRITQLGRNVADSLEPVVECMTRLARGDSPSARRRLLLLALALGDLVLAQPLAESGDTGDVLAAQISRLAEDARQRRAARMIQSVRARSPNADSCRLRALADLGIKYAGPVVKDCALHSPVDGTANTALAILVHWNGIDLVPTLTELIARRYTEASGLRSTPNALRRGSSGEDSQPRQYQIVRAVIALLQRERPGSLKPALREKIVSLLETAVGANAGEAALLLYVLDKPWGLNALRAALAGRIPIARSDSAAACVLLGTLDASQVLFEALEHPDLQVQHVAACALRRFPSAEAREREARWCARLDGIESPEGTQIPIQGRTITAYSGEEVSHANMDVFLSSALDRLRQDFGPVLSPSEP